MTCLITHVNIVSNNTTIPTSTTETWYIDKFHEYSLRLCNRGWKRSVRVYLPQAFPYESPLSCNSVLLELCFLLHFFCYHHFPHFQSQISFPFRPADNGIASSCEKITKEIESFNCWKLFLRADVSSDGRGFFLFSLWTCTLWAFRFIASSIYSKYSWL